MKKCVIPFSGGQDSTTILYSVYNSNEYDEIYCLSFNYGQRHEIELKCAEWNINHLNQIGKCKVFWKTIDIPFLRDLAPTSCLTNDNIAVPDGSNVSSNKLPTSYVPNRNMIFISIAASYAEAIGATDVYHGAVAADLDGGYWDCRPEFFENLNKTFSVNFGHKIQIVTPLLYMTKKDIILEGIKNGVDFAHTWTDYSGGKQIKTINNQGIVEIIYLADANSASSKCRLEGFKEAGYIDPLNYNEDLTKFWETNNCKEIVYGE